MSNSPPLPLRLEHLIAFTQLDIARASVHMREALAHSGLLERPPPPKIALGRLRFLGRVCGLPDLSDTEEAVADAA